MSEHEGLVLRIVRGAPDEVELAALTAVVGALAAAPAPAAQPAARPVWSDPRTMLRRPIGHGPGAWRASGLLP
ncbi:acyl-CoA carboxylase subunit epsilon [Actinophytocola sp.]|uniref:acyl-CoA carboxylase subunit epsilon n=1 Tax=Actinophytocola sp. TaxID=1872138 RepID=UPI002D7E79C7|nr:acyl-CoA carboxylase subunit epsilon [Actinophytocola sp.]HET9139632.1 acyl-CoA carboxylase subunit epsilon [Actinophytocola sp.]HEU5110630.1 acyl-CoA carboxylase subunit epsilon [Micromonosporaceae bacterium]